MAKKNVLTRGKKQQALALMQQGQPAEAKPLLDQVCRTDRADVEAQFLLGIANGMLGQHEPAEKAFRQILKLIPKHPDANNNLGLSLEAQGRAAEALPYFEQAVRLAPDNAGFVFNLANTCESLGHLKQAKHYYEQAIALAPNYPEAFCNLGNVLQAEGDNAEAVAAFQQAIRLSDEFVQHYPQVYINLGNALMDTGRDEEALAAYQLAVKIQNDASAYLALGNAYLQKGNREEAAVALRRAIDLKPESGSAYRNLVQTRRFREHDSDVIAMEALYQRPDLNDDDRMHLAFALGKIYNDLKDDEHAFACYAEGNRLKRKSIDYSFAEDASYFAAIKETFNPDFFQQRAGSGFNDASPIFIIGMPRSGTTLVEQILASHSQVHGAGELNDLRIVIERACDAHNENFPQALLHLSQNEFAQISAGYLERLHAYAPDAPRITDKMPHNFLYLGLIHLLLPKAKVIHCQRNPMDNALSIFRALFTQGHAYAYDLAELGQYYRLYQDLMAHWRRLMPEGFYELQYEELVTDQEMQTRRLLAYCELPWQEDCLEFHRTKRVVRTASLAQVREPMHTGSVEAWRRYEEQLLAFVDALQAE
jgi:Flp pilus assembly protein TadD